MKYLEIIPDFLSMYGVFTPQSTSQIRQEMSISRLVHSADEYNLHGAKRLFTIPNVLSASCPSVKQDGENKCFLHTDCFT